VEAVDAGNLEGERFTLALDDRLRGLAKAETERQADIAADTGAPTPTPREIQVRVRAGESAEAVAADAGIALEKVMRFAYPVLQERTRVTDEARRARARRGGDGLLVPFGELIDSRLARHSIDPTAVRWDAFRREDGGWTVTARFNSYQRDMLAKFSFALANRTVSALDDIAADLLSDRPVQALLEPAPPVAEPAAQPVADDWEAGPPRLTAVPDPGRTGPRAQEASPAIRPPSRRQKAHTRPVPVTVDDELFDQDAFDQQPWHEPPLPFEVGAGRAPAPRPQAQRPAGDAAAVEAPAAELEPATAEPAPTIDEASFAAPVAGPAAESVGLTAHSVPEVEADSESVPEDSPVSVPIAAGDTQGKRGRRAGEKPRMPSWDDILLGVRHKSD